MYDAIWNVCCYQIQQKQEIYKQVARYEADYRVHNQLVFFPGSNERWFKEAIVFFFLNRKYLYLFVYLKKKEREDIIHYKENRGSFSCERELRVRQHNCIIQIHIKGFNSYTVHKPWAR